MLCKCYADTETCGFHGMPVLLQFAYDDGPIHLWDIWKQPVFKTLCLLTHIMERCLVGFNLSFDMFQLCKLHTIWRLLPFDLIPEDNIPLVAEMEPLGRDGPCLKPASALDLMLFSRKGSLQALMARNDVRIRKVPSVLAAPLAHELETRIEFDGIMFAKRADPNSPRWQVYDRTNTKGEIDPNFKDVVLKFNAGGGLKHLARHVLGLDPEFNSFKDVNVAKEFQPVELGFVPFALGLSTPEKDWQVWDKHGKLKGQAWPALIHHHIEHWANNEEARRYAKDDVKYTRMLDEYFKHPEPGDDDSVLACMVAAVRWHGFEVDLDTTAKLLKDSRKVLEASPVNINKPPQVRNYIRPCLIDEEAFLLDLSTKKANLEQIRDEMIVTESGEECLMCSGIGRVNEEMCPRCGGHGELQLGSMPAAQRADEILKIKTAAKEVELHSKLQQAGRFHASFKVIGTLSSRMSGSDGLNAQGIKNSDDVRRMFPLAWGGMILCGGDFDSFEVVLADAVFGDVKLRADLRKGTKIHAIMGMALYPGKTYEEICASKGFADGGDIDMYTRGKQAVFAMLYGGDHTTVHNKLAIPMKVAEEAFERFQKDYTGVKAAREANFERFQALRQPAGIGSAIYWNDPADYSETFLGFHRYFTLENKICEALFKLAQSPPKTWRNVNLSIVRRDRVQTVGGAVSSALYGAAFQLQAANTRAANNHLIQSPGAQITKTVQRNIWELQPPGAHDWVVAPMNVHDEVMCVTHPSAVDKLTGIVIETVESFRDRVPLIAMEWMNNIESWGAAKAGDGDVVKIQPPDELVVEALDDKTDDQADLPDWDGSLFNLYENETLLETLIGGTE